MRSDGEELYLIILVWSVVILKVVRISQKKKTLQFVLHITSLTLVTHKDYDPKKVSTLKLMLRVKILARQKGKTHIVKV